MNFYLDKVEMESFLCACYWRTFINIMTNNEFDINILQEEWQLS